MDIIQNENTTLEIYENDIDLYMNDFCEKHNIQNLTSISQNVWNGMLMHVCRYVFKGTNKLKIKSSINKNYTSSCNAYDINKVNALCDYYISLCNQYDKEVSIMGFSKLTGIDNDTIQDWGRTERVAQNGLMIYKKLCKEREESLSAKLVTGKQNPVGILGVLNRHYQWNMPGVSKEASTRKALDASQLPQLGGSSNAKSAELPVIEVENS